MTATVWTRGVRSLQRRAQALRPTQRTSLWELRARRPPDAAAYRSIGSNAVVVPPGAVQNPHLVSIGAGVLLHEGVSILVAPNARGVTIGDGTVLSRYAHIACAQQVTIGLQVSSSDHIAVLDTWGPVGVDRPHSPPTAPVTIEDGAYLGFGCIVGPGVTVGTGAFVGEGAVVLDDVPPHTVVYGNPAVPVRTLTAAGWAGPRFP